MGAETAVLAAGTGIQAYSKYQEGRIRAEASKQEAKIKRAQAAEMLERLAIEEVNLAKQGEEFKGKQLGAYAAGGVALGTGATLIALEDTTAKIAQKISETRRDTIFRANQLMRGADIALTEGEQFKTVGSLGAAGSLLEGGASYYKNRSANN